MGWGEPMTGGEHTETHSAQSLQYHTHAVSRTAGDQALAWACVRGSKNWLLWADKETETQCGSLPRWHKAEPGFRSGSLGLLIFGPFLSTVHPIRWCQRSLPSEVGALGGLRSFIHHSSRVPQPCCGQSSARTQVVAMGQPRPPPTKIAVCEGDGPQT